MKRFLDIFRERDLVQLKELRSVVSISSFYEVICPELERLNSLVNNIRPGLRVVDVFLDRNEHGRFSLFVKRNQEVQILNTNDVYQLVVNDGIGRDGKED